MMSKKDFIALADALREPLNGPVMVHETGKPTRTQKDFVIDALCRFMRGQNPQFKEDRWRAYLAGECGPSGGPLKPTPSQKRARAGLIPSDPRDHEPETRPYQPKTGAPCGCRPGVARDNCPNCEGTGQRIDFAAIRARKS